jgi:hypothetical protein
MFYTKSLGIYDSKKRGLINNLKLPRSEMIESFYSQTQAFKIYILFEKLWRNY